MVANTRSPWWPYLLLLGGLFILSIAVPRSWQSESRAPADHEQISPIRAPAAPPIAIVRPSRPANGSVESSPESSADTTSPRSVAVPTSRLRTVAEYKPMVETIAKRIADLRRLAPENQPQAAARPKHDPRSDRTELPDGAQSPASIVSPPATAKATAPQSVLKNISARSTPTDWPASTALLAALARLSENPGCAAWALRALELCESLDNQTTDEISRHDIVDRLKPLPAEAEQLAAALPDPSAAAALRRTGFALQRRVAIWETMLAESRLDLAPAAAALPHSFHDLLKALEQFESTGLPSDASNLAQLDERFAASPASIDRRLAESLDTYYRNANVRLVLAADLLNRLAPELPANSAPVNDVILGRTVRGTSTTNGQLFVQLVPDPARLNLLVEARGQVQSQTLADAGAATFSSTGEANYSVQKSVIVSAQSATIAPASAAADGDSQLTGVSTRFDGRPVLGSVARNRAIAQHEALHDEAQREVDEKIASGASQRMDNQVDGRLQQVKANIRRDVLDPLKKLDLELQPISLATSPERVTMRLRLASPAQLGSNTPRPQAPSGSLASLQLHESALNNFLDHLQLAGRTFTLPELFAYVADRTSRPKLQPPADLPEGTIQFAQRDPVTVHCDNGVVRLTFAIAELRQRDHEWHNFSITATYRPEIDHLHVRLARQGPLELGGDTYRGQAEPILRGIFSKLLPRERQLELVPEVVADSSGLADLAITQCAIDEGWIGLAIGPNRGNAPRDVAKR